MSCLFNTCCRADLNIKSNFIEHETNPQERAQIINNLVSKKRSLFGLKLFNLLESDNKACVFALLNRDTKNDIYKLSKEIDKQKILKSLDEAKRSDFIQYYPYHLKVTALFLSLLAVAGSNERGLDGAGGEVGCF